MRKRSVPKPPKDTRDRGRGSHNSQRTQNGARQPPQNPRGRNPNGTRNPPQNPRGRNQNGPRQPPQNPRGRNPNPPKNPRGRNQNAPRQPPQNPRGHRNTRTQRSNHRTVTDEKGKRVTKRALRGRVKKKKARFTDEINVGFKMCAYFREKCFLVDISDDFLDEIESKLKKYRDLLAVNPEEDGENYYISYILFPPSLFLFASKKKYNKKNNKK